jgi:hypothetical protein
MSDTGDSVRPCHQFISLGDVEFFINVVQMNSAIPCRRDSSLFDKPVTTSCVISRSRYVSAAISLLPARGGFLMSQVSMVSGVHQTLGAKMHIQRQP